MKNSILSYLFLIGLLGSLNAQSNSYESIAKLDSINISRAERLAIKVLGVDYDDFSYVVFSVKNKIMLINKNCKGYRIYCFEEEFDFKNQKKEFIKKYYDNLEETSLLKKVFDSIVCKAPFRYSTFYSKDYSHDTDYIYFTKIEKGLKKCELNIPTIYKQKTKEKESVFVEQDVFDYLFSKLIKE
ncbi:hypothetical protein [Aquimarina algiphila]|uniref:hypothetical protein n=1 Tax=Aquimarina algiphila TaxID=2047982 RepID=UPI00232DB34A|nr:hypothetical protein [Aquimarina algiphila]